MVDLWHVDLGEQRRAADTLSAGELQRAEQIIDPRRRRRWEAAHAALRDVLARYLRLEPGGLHLTHGIHGKPRLCGPIPANAGSSAFPAPATPHFSLTHSGHLALIAVAAHAPVGVDAELRDGRGATAWRAIAKRLPAAAALEGRAARNDPQSLLWAWTRYEALAKCLGTGLTETAAGWRDRDDVWIMQIDLGEGAAAALAVRSQEPELRFYRWRPLAPAAAARARGARPSFTES